MKKLSHFMSIVERNVLEGTMMPLRMANISTKWLCEDRSEQTWENHNHGNNEQTCERRNPSHRHRQHRSEKQAHCSDPFSILFCALCFVLLFFSSLQELLNRILMSFKEPKSIHTYIHTYKIPLKNQKLFNYTKPKIPNYTLILRLKTSNYTLILRCVISRTKLKTQMRDITHARTNVKVLVRHHT